LASENETSRFFRILDIVKTEFSPRDAYVREGTPTFVVPLEATIIDKTNRLAVRLASEGLGLVLEQVGSEVVLQVVPRQLVARPAFRLAGLNLSLILFLTTIVTVAISGYYIALDYVEVLRKLQMISPTDEPSVVWSQTALYAITLMSVAGLHEVGHVIACRRNGIKATMPLFIPGIPRFGPGTFGALILQERPASNRNQLFDIGISGPMVGFAIAVVASVIGYSSSLPLTKQQYNYVFGPQGAGGVIFPPLLFLFLGPWVFSSPNAYTYVMHPLAFAGWVGTLITFLNAFPIGQMDGGHVSRALLGRVWHRRLGYVMITLMFLAGWWPMAILVIFLTRLDHPGTLDDVTPLTSWRKALALAFLAMFIAVFTLSPDAPLLALLFG